MSYNFQSRRPIMTLRGVYCTKTAHHCRNSLLSFVFAFSNKFAFSPFSPFPAFPCEIGHIHVAIPYVHSIGATVGHHIRPWEAKIEYQTYFQFSLHSAPNNDANRLIVLYRYVRQKMIKIIPQWRKESLRLQIPQTGGPLSESSQGDLILLNNAVVGRINLDQLVPCTC